MSLPPTWNAFAAELQYLPTYILRASSIYLHVIALFLVSPPRLLSNPVSPTQASALWAVTLACILPASTPSHETASALAPARVELPVLAR